MSKNPIINDYAPGTGVYEGDLRYGRKSGNEFVKHKDFAANRQDGIASNAPVMPLTLVEPRDPQVWKKDPRVKEVKKSTDNAQYVTNHLLDLYASWGSKLRSNIHLTVGKQRL